MPRYDRPDVDKDRDNARARYRSLVVRLGDELDSLVKLISHQRVALENEVFDGLGHKQLGTTKDTLAKLKLLSGMFESATAAKIRFDKSMKQMAENMTHSEERAAVRDFVRAMEDTERRDFINDLRKWHLENTPKAIAGAAAQPSTQWDGQELGGFPDDPSDS